MATDHQRNLYIGLDVGSISLNTVVMTPDRVILEEDYSRLHGRPLETVHRVLAGVLDRYAQEDLVAVAVTGVGGKLAGELLGAAVVNEVIAQAKCAELLAPHVRSIIEMGGEDSKLILLTGGEGGLEIVDFAMNTLCAAGTGSFLDQQAHRLGLERFGSHGDRITFISPGSRL